MTKILLWYEYQQAAGDNYPGIEKRSMRQHHVAGEKLFLYLCGPTLPVVNRDTGEISHPGRVKLHLR
ncbi:hypothetical protein [Pantoea sp. SORGH_AS_0659]|uniref:hypothetical protein n=1 Tax=Pantoea sp. SORGH_AS_0659 TaxID=3062597 RepID=UPI00285719BF|nr:hypothetical protein [Pantoea sp. SORGH_AS_0659]MDR6352596.1 hypothetical protein [Pantoea sp. SORGH_AS_0659]